MDLLLLLKKNDEVLGYQGKGDFSLEEKNKKVSKIIKNSKNNDYMFAGLQIVNPKVIKNKKQKFSLSEIFLESIVKKKIYRKNTIKSSKIKKQSRV